MHPYETDIHVPFLARGPGIAAGARLAQMSGNVDLLPTVLDLAGVAHPAGVDGRSMLPFLAPALAPRPTRRAAWRDRFLIEYWAVAGDLWGSHTATWSPKPRRCAGSVPSCGREPCHCVEGTTPGGGDCYMIDSKVSNTWRALRVVNATHDTQYIEYAAGGAWDWGAPPQFYELYNLTADPYQMVNVYPAQDPAVRAALHAELAAYNACRAGGCP